MALINCPECNKEISDAVENCPHCGYPLKKRKTIALTPKNVGIFFAGLAVMAMILIIIASNSLSDTEKASVQKVNDAITAIGDVTVNSEKSIDTAEKEYESLSEKCRRHVNNYKNLKEARTEYNKLRADETKNLISKIGIVDANSKSIIEKAETSYNALSDTQKVLVDNAEVIAQSYEQLSIILTSDVEKKIKAINKVSIESGEQIKAARKAYDNLSDEDKSKVFSFNVLENAEKQYSDIVVSSCIQKIDNIGTVSLDSENIINEANSLYSSLPNEIKNKVSNYDKLLSADKELKKLKKEKEDFEKVINPGDVIKTDKWEINYKKTRVNAKIYPNNTSGYYSYYYANDNETFIDMIFEIKNIDIDILGISDLVKDVKVEYDGSTLTKFCTLYMSYGSRIERVYDWDGLDALDSTTLHATVDMPREIQTDEKPLKVRLTIDGQEKIIVIRADNTTMMNESLSDEKEKKSETSDDNDRKSDTQKKSEQKEEQKDKQNTSSEASTEWVCGTWV